MRTLARAHLANGEPALAEETMRRAVDANPKDAGARLDLAKLLSQLGKPEQAKPIIDELVKQQPDNMEALETQFKVAAATGDKSEAQAAADAMVATHPKLADTSIRPPSLKAHSGWMTPSSCIPPHSSCSRSQASRSRA